MNTKQICQAIKITPKALRVYENCGLVFPQREKNGYRNYTDENMVKLREILLLKEMGFSLQQIKALTARSNMEKSQNTIHSLTKSLCFQMKVIEKRVEELASIRNAINDSINDLLNEPNQIEAPYFEKINKTLAYNRGQRQDWIDRWGFDAWAGSYDEFVKNVQGELGIFEGYAEALTKVRQLAMEDSPLRILDLGCGTGNLCGELSNNLEIVGVDQSIEMLLIARKKYPKMSLRLGNFLEKSYCTNYFDVVVSTYALHHIKPEEKVKVLKNMCDYLTNKGKIIIVDLMFFNYSERERCHAEFLARNRTDLWEIIDDEYYFVIEDLQGFVAEMGLTMHYEHIANFTWLITIEHFAYGESGQYGVDLCRE